MPTAIFVGVYVGYGGSVSLLNPTVTMTLGSVDAATMTSLLVAAKFSRGSSNKLA